MNDKNDFAVSDENLEHVVGGADISFKPFPYGEFIGKPLSVELVATMQAAHPEWNFIMEAELDSKPEVCTQICIDTCPNCGKKLETEFIYRFGAGYRGDMFCGNCYFCIGNYLVNETNKF